MGDCVHGWARQMGEGLGPGGLGTRTATMPRQCRLMSGRGQWRGTTGVLHAVGGGQAWDCMVVVLQVWSREGHIFARPAVLKQGRADAS